MAFMSAKNTAGGIGARAKDQADRGANKADSSRAVQMLARLGYVVLGVLHLIIGWFAIRIATGDGGGEEASNSGALAEIADKPGGQALLWFAVAGLVGLVIWRLVGIFRHGWSLILAAIINHQPLPIGHGCPEPWPGGLLIPTDSLSLPTPDGETWKNLHL